MNHRDPRDTQPPVEAGIPADATDVLNRQRGNSVVIALILMLLIVGGVLFFMLSPTSVTPAPGTVGSPAATNGSTPEFPESDEAAAKSAETPTFDAIPANRVTTEAGSPGLRTFFGRVVDFDDQPIANISIRRLTGPVIGSRDVLHEDTVVTIPVADSEVDLTAFLNATEVRSGLDGSFEIDALPGDALSLSSSGFAPALVRISMQAAGDERAVDLEVERAFEEALAGTNIDPASFGQIRARGDSIGSVTWTESEEDRRSIVLGPAIFVTGTVTSAVDGSPAEGTEVVLREGRDLGLMGMALSQASEGRRSVVNPEGEYAIVLESAGQFRVGVRSGSTDFAPTPLDEYTALQLRQGDTEHVIDLTVQPGGAVEGIVVDRRGNPIAEQTISAIAQMELTDFTSGGMLGRLDPRTARTASDGTFRIGGLPLDFAYNVIAEVPDLARTTVQSEKITLEQPIASVELIAVRGSSISGTVISEQGSALGGVQVMILPDFQALMEGGIMAAADFSIEPVLSEEDGSFVLEHLHAGEYNLVAGDAMANYNPFGGDTDGEKVEVDGIADVTGVVLVASPEAQNLRGDLSGTVRDGDGKPLAGVTITITETEEETMLDEDAPPRVVVTDVGGRFFAKDAAIAETMVEADLAGFSSELEFLSAGQTQVDLVLELVATIRGRVVLRDGTVPRVEFRVSAEEISADGSTSLETQLSTMMGGSLVGTEGNSDGTFEIEEVPLGTVEVVARAPGFAKARSAPITLRAGDVVEGIELVLTRGARVLGTVVAPDGAPLPGAKVMCTPAKDTGGMQDLIAQSMPAMFGNHDTGLTNADGSYEIPNLEPGEYVLRALHDAYARSEPVTITVRPELDTAAPRIAMLIGGVIEGRATREGKPIARMMVQTFSKGAMKQAMTDAEGSYRFDNLPDGEFAVMFMDLAGSMRPGGGSGMRTRMVEVVAGTTATVDVSFGTGHTIRGTITNAPNTAMRMLTLRKPGGPAPEDIDPLDMEAAMESARFQVAMAMLGSEGEFEITDVEPGEYILEMPKMPENPMDIEGYSKMDRVPYVRKVITVGSSDVTVNARAD